MQSAPCLAFGPVPSRRRGRSLGINNIPPKIGYEGDAFSSTGNAAEDLLSITAVHPMRKEAVQHLLHRIGADSSVLEKLVRQGKLITSEYNGHLYYMRNLMTN